MKSKKKYLPFIMIFFLPAFIITSCEDEKQDIPKVVEITSPDFTACIHEEVLLIGEGFSTNSSDNIVKFGDIQAEVLSASTTELVFNVPEGASSSRITVKTKRREIAQGPFFTLSSDEYYIKFKANEESKVYSVCILPYMEGNECMWGSMWNGGVNFVFLRVCTVHEKITPAMLQSWNGDQLLFAGSTPIVTFGYKEENEDEVHSEWADKTGLGWPDNESELNITSVTEIVVKDNTFYIVTGNFKCFVSSPWDEDIAITEGEFRMPFLKK